MIEVQNQLEIKPKTAIAQNRCYPQFFLGDIQIYNGNNIDVLQD